MISDQKRHWRLWPGIAAVLLMWLARFGAIKLDLGAVGLYIVIGGMFAGLLGFILWWAVFSRAAGFERWFAFVVMIAAVAGISRLLHPSISGAMMGFMFYLYSVPTVCLAFVLWAVATQRLTAPVRRISMVAAIAAGSGVWTLVRSDGITTTGSGEFAWRWSRTAEQQLLATAVPPPPVPAIVEAPKPAPTAAPAEPKQAIIWPGFRGADRTGIIPGVRIKTDWSALPPAEVWRRPVGPGWSSFAVRGDLIYTQEQRGEEEIVACYNAGTGKPVWEHRDKARFWEANAGAGPRATPTLSGNRVYTCGATGIVNALDARTGTKLWSRDATADTGGKVPYWGFSSSPLVEGDIVIVHAGALAAYDASTGAPRWSGAAKGGSYSSPQLVSLEGVPQVLMMNKDGIASISPADGALLWEHAWPGMPIVQPALTPDGDVLITNEERGARRLAVRSAGIGWKVEERWTSNRLKPSFNDFVIHNGHAFGFDGSILACIDLKDGARKWKGGRYGQGQLVLLPDQDLLLVISEEGELALVAAATEQFKEIARAPAIDGKTWNHPVLAGGLLFVRNSQEMAAFRLPLASR